MQRSGALSICFLLALCLVSASSAYTTERNGKHDVLGWIPEGAHADLVGNCKAEESRGHYVFQVPVEVPSL